MTALYTGYRNEFNKLMKRRKYIVFLCIGAFLCILWAVLGNLISGFIGGRGGMFINLTPTPMGALPFFLQVMIPFLIFMGVTDLITTEKAEHTMKAMVYRPIERWKLYTGKLLAVMTYAAIYLACIFVVSTALDQTVGRGQGLGQISIALASYALTLVPLAVLTMFAAFMAIICRGGSLSMFLLIVIYLAFSVVPAVFPVMSELLFTSYLGWHRLWIGATPGAQRMLHMLTIILGYGVVFFTAGSLIFDKKEF